MEKKNTLLRFLIVFIASIFLVSCAEKGSVPEVPQQSVELVENKAYMQGNTAFAAQDFASALHYYEQAIQDPSLPVLYKQESYLRIAQIKNAAGAYTSGVQNAIKAVELGNAILKEERWFSTWYEGMSHQQSSVALKYAEKLLLTVKDPKDIPPKVLIPLTCIFWSNGQIEKGLSVARYTQYNTRSVVEKKAIEVDLSNRFTGLSSNVQNVLYALVTPTNQTQFPYNVLAYRQSLYLQSQGEVEAAAEIQDSLRAAKALQDLSVLALEPVALNKEYDIVFLLPFTEPYKRYTWQIANGATVAQAQLKQLGKPVKIHFVNTLASDWKNQLAKFKKGTIVAGPLRSKTFKDLEATGYFEKYLFFTFLSQLPDGVEGKTAWRFYLNQEDQVNTVIDFARSFGVKRYGILYPFDGYGKTMAGLFKDAVTQQGSTVDTIKMYSGSAAMWLDRISEYLRVRDVGGQKVSDTSFSATFLPDTFVNATIIVPAFFYNGEQRQIFLGTSLWEERKDEANYIPENFATAVYPSAWNPYSGKEEVLILKAGLSSKTPSEPNRWSALGYDFVRFAQQLYANRATNKATLNTYLAKKMLFSWAMAPIVWDANGIAKQKLYVLTPSGQYGKPVNKEVFTENLRKAYMMHNAHVEKVYKK